MNAIIQSLILLGSALMVVNILRYCGFMRSLWSLDRWRRLRGYLAAPLFLLCFFLRRTRSRSWTARSCMTATDPAPAIPR